MVAALLYLQLCTWRNLLLSQLRRFRKPQYLLGLLAGVGWIVFVVIRPFDPHRAAPRSGATQGADVVIPFSPAFEPLVAGGVLLLAAFTWFFPSKRAGLDFSEAEIAWFFPAPVRRRTLVHFRLLRTQAGLLFSAFVLAVIMSGFSGGRLHAASLPGWWILMSALELHRQAAGFTRTRLHDLGVPHWGRRGVVLLVLAAIGLLAWQRLQPWLPELAEGASPGPERLGTIIRSVFGEGVLGAILVPFTLLVRPMVSGSGGGMGIVPVLLPAVGILALLYFWALRTAVGFEDASVERAERRARLIEVARTGNWHLAQAHHTEARAPFPLPPQGPRLLGLTWKNLIAAHSLLASPLLLAIGVVALSGLIVLKLTAHDAPFLKVFGAMIAGLAPMVFFMGPELARFDLRQDLPQADILKTLPLPGWQLVLGEVLAPMLALTILQWLMIAAAAVAFPEWGSNRSLGGSGRVAVALAAVLLAPALTLTMLLLHNASALLFPAWVRLGPTGAQGFEAMGQRMLLMIMHMVGLVVALLVPAVFGTVAFLALRFLTPWTVALPVAAAVTAVGLTFESALGLKWLGDRFERMDITD